MKYIAKIRNVEYRIEEHDIPRFIAMGCTIYEVASNGYRVYNAPAGKEDLQNKISELEGVVADLRNQIAIDNARNASLAEENAKLKEQIMQHTAEQAASEAAARKAGKKG